MYVIHNSLSKDIFISSAVAASTSSLAPDIVFSHENAKVFLHFPPDETFEVFVLGRGLVAGEDALAVQSVEVRDAIPERVEHVGEELAARIKRPIEEPHLAPPPSRLVLLSDWLIS